MPRFNSTVVVFGRYPRSWGKIAKKMADSKHAANSTTVINKAIEMIAKYKVGRKEVLHIWNIVPNPKNRGGAPCTSVRCRQLSGDISSIGFLDSEARHNSWAVESPPCAGSSCDDSGRSSVATEEAPTVVGGTTATKTKFQEVFESMHMSDPDIAKTWGSHTNAFYGGLSHNHLLLLCRNIQAGMPGCECTAQELANQTFERDENPPTQEQQT